MADRSIQRAGRRYRVDSGGVTDLSRVYTVVRDDVLSENGEAASFPGVPAIGAAHPVLSGLYVAYYDVEEGRDAAKKTLDVTVHYARQAVEGGDGELGDAQVDEWGWDGGTAEKELTTDEDKKPVVNSAGDPFDSVPSVIVPAPVFTKVFKTKSRIGGALDFNCTTNKSQVTVGAFDCPANTLLCTVAEKRIIGGGDWRYQYSVQLRYRSNVVDIARSGTPVEIGWDVAIMDAGMRAYGTGDGAAVKAVITLPDRETHEPCAVTSPAMLDGEGHVLTGSASGTPEAPYYFRFKAYQSADFPQYFISEPG